SQAGWGSGRGNGKCNCGKREAAIGGVADRRARWISGWSLSGGIQRGEGCFGSAVRGGFAEWRAINRDRDICVQHGGAAVQAIFHTGGVVRAGLDDDPHHAPEHGRVFRGGAKDVARGRNGIGSEQMENDIDSYRAGGVPRDSYRDSAGASAGGGGDSTSAVHRIGEPLLEPGLGTANGVVAGNDLQLRVVAVRGLASPGVGGGVGAAGTDLDHQHPGADDSVARNSSTEGIEMQASPNPELSVKVNAPAGAATTRENAASIPMRMRISKLNFYYGTKQILFDISMGIADKRVTALIGPSGCGKSTLLRILNRMHETVSTSRLEGEVLLDQQNILAQDVTALRRRVGMVFQRPNPFPKSIFENVAYGLRINGTKLPMPEAVEKSLRHAALWDEVKDHLHKSAYELSGGQQQRLCIARALAVEPEVLLMDEPCSALDPISTAKIEDLIDELKRDYTIVIVTHNMQQAARVSHFTAFILNGRLIEFGRTDKLFTYPEKKETEAYITGRFG